MSIVSPQRVLSNSRDFAPFNYTCCTQHGQCNGLGFRPCLFKEKCVKLIMYNLHFFIRRELYFDILEVKTSVVNFTIHTAFFTRF